MLEEQSGVSRQGPLKSWLSGLDPTQMWQGSPAEVRIIWALVDLQGQQRPGSQDRESHAVFLS